MTTTDHTSPDAVQTADRLPTNLHMLVAEVFLFGLALPATARFLPIYAIRLDASAALLGWLTALPAIVALVSSAFSEWWRRKCGSLERATVLSGFGYRVLFILPAFTPFFPAQWQTTWLLVAVGLPAIAQGISAVVFMVMLRSSVPDARVTAIVSRRSMMFNVGVATGTLAFGVWLEQAVFPFNYQMMYVVAFALSLISLEHVRRIRVLDSVSAPTGPPDPAKALASPGFRRVALVTMLSHITFFTIVPIIPLRLVNELGANEGYMSLFALAELLAAAIMASQTGRLVRRWGSQTVIAVGLFGTALAALILGLSDSLTVALGAAALSGGMWTMCAVSGFGFFAENTPQASVSRFTRIFNQVTMFAAFVGPLVGSQLVSSTPLTITTVLLLGAVARTAAAAWIFSDDLRGWSQRRMLRARARRAHGSRP